MSKLFIALVFVAVTPIAAHAANAKPTPGQVRKETMTAGAGLRATKTTKTLTATKTKAPGTFDLAAAMREINDPSKDSPAMAAARAAAAAAPKGVVVE